MPDPDLNVVLGSVGRWRITGKTKGRAAVTTFGGSDTPSAKIWPGGEQPTLVVPTVTWDDPALCKVFLTVTPAQQAAAGLTAGVYHVEVGATPVSDGMYRVIYDNLIAFKATTGAAAADVSWVTYADLANWSGQIDALQDRDVDRTRFSRQRAQATKEVISYVLRRYCPVPGQARRLVDAAHTGSGSYLNYSGPADGSDPPSRTQLAAWLAVPARVVMSEDLTKAVALKAAAMVYMTNPGTNNPYAQQAAADTAAADLALAQAFVEVDTKTTVDGVPTMRFSRNVTYLT